MEGRPATAAWAICLAGRMRQMEEPAMRGLARGMQKRMYEQNSTFIVYWYYWSFQGAIIHPTSIASTMARQCATAQGLAPGLQ